MLIFFNLFSYARGLSGPHNAGHYNSKCCETEFFNCHWGNYDKPYGHFFLSWYSSMLIEHGERILSAVSEVLRSRGQPRICKSMTMVGHASSLPARVARILVCVGQTFSGWWPLLRSQVSFVVHASVNEQQSQLRMFLRIMHN